MKKHLLFTAIALCFLPCFASSQVIEWQNTIGGNSVDWLNYVEETDDGGYILGGYSYSNISGDKTEANNGDYDFWIVKTDESGIIQWQNTIGGSESDILISIQQTLDGGYILGGHSQSNISGDKTENRIGLDDYWLIKTDASGIIQWQNTIGGDYFDILLSIQQTPDGGYILGGYSDSNTSGDKTESCKGNFDYWVVKTDATGNVQWQNTIGGNDADKLFSIEQTADGGYILGGNSNSNISADKLENSNGLYDCWLVKIDATGTMQWQKTIGGNNDDFLSSVKQTSDGGYILGVCSYSDISGDKTENSNGLGDYWIVKTDATGNILWQNTIGSIGDDQLHYFEKTTDGGYILAGTSNANISGDKTENDNGSGDFWIVKTDSSGLILWQNTIGGNNFESIYSIKQTDDDEYILGGYSYSNISFDKTENCQGVHDYWVVKITDKYNLISGKLYFDINSNNIHDSGEPPIVSKQVSESNSGRLGFSDQNGNYGVSVLDSGTFSVSTSSLNYFNIAPTTHIANFTSVQQTDSVNNFAIQPAGVFNDLCITITPLGAFRAGSYPTYQIHYENVGTTTLNPSVIFFPDNDLNVVAAYPTSNITTSDSLIWNFGPLAPFQSGNILVTVNVIVSTPIGTLINSGVRIEPIIGDANTSCNYSNWEVFTTGSFDPNDILVDEDTLLATQFPNPPYLEYIIRFQNTGNDTAFAVKVLNPIDTTLFDLPSIEFVASSHPVNLSWIPWEQNMEYRFENILLPDSNVNEPGSHGFVRYRIKPKSMLSAGDSITNYAAIYFDFNAPVITNTAFTRIVLPTSISETIASSGNLLLYPNPANSTLTIESVNLQSSECRLTISDVAGRTMLSKNITSSSTKHNIDISSLSQGIYFVQLQSGEINSRNRFVKK